MNGHFALHAHLNYIVFVQPGGYFIHIIIHVLFLRRLCLTVIKYKILCSNCMESPTMGGAVLLLLLLLKNERHKSSCQT